MPELPDGTKFFNPNYTLKDSRVEYDTSDSFFNISNNTIYMILGILILIIIFVLYY